MAIDRTGISSLQSGAPEIKYTGAEGPKSPDQQLMAQADPMLVEMYQQYVFEMEEQGMQPMSFREFMQQAISGMADGGRAGFQYGGGADFMNTHKPRLMGNPAVMEEVEDMREFKIANPNVEDVADYKGYYERLKKLKELQKLMGKGMAYGGSANPTYTQKRKQSLAYGGIAGVDGRKRYGIGSWFQKAKDKFVDDIIPNEIKDNPLLSSVVAGTLLNQYGVPFTGTPGDRMGQDWFSDLISGAQDKAIQQTLNNPLGFAPTTDEPLDIEDWKKNIPQIDIIKTIPRGTTDIVKDSSGTGQEGNLIGRMLEGLGSGIGTVGDVATKIGQTIIPGGETGYGNIYGGLGNIAGGAGSIAGGVGDVAKKTLATILPGGDPGYVPEGLYKTLFGTPAAYAKDSVEAMRKIGIGGNQSVYDPSKMIPQLDKQGPELSPFRKALATILPGGNPGYIPDGLYKTFFGAINPFSKDGMLRTGTTGNPNILGPLTMGLSLGALDAATRKDETLPTQQGIDIPAIRAAALQGQGGAFLPPASATTAYANGGRTGYYAGNMVEQKENVFSAWSSYKNQGGPKDFEEWYSDNYLPEAAGYKPASEWPYGFAPASKILKPEAVTIGKMAQGGRIGYADAGNVEDKFMELVSQLMEQGFTQQEAIDEAKERLGMAYGGRIGAQEGGIMQMASYDYNDAMAEAFDAYERAIKDGIIPSTMEFDEYLELMQDSKKETAPRTMAQEGGLMDLGGMEKDYRNEGGFVPIGGQERADDVPARLSKNEFVFTADAVRSAGGGDIDKGAEVMENVMEHLEQGGQISQESQGLEGARNMFATAQRLEGVM
jgi:hypothetical protein